MDVPPDARRRFGRTPFGPVAIWYDARGTHALAADGRHVVVALPARHRVPDGDRLLADGAPVIIDGRHAATLHQATSGILRSARRVHLLDAGTGLVPDGAHLRRHRVSHVWLQTHERVLVRPAGPVPFAFRQLRIAPGVRDELALAFTAIWPAVEFAV